MSEQPPSTFLASQEMRTSYMFVAITQNTTVTELNGALSIGYLEKLVKSEGKLSIFSQEHN